MANPNNITLRSEKGSYITFSEMDLNLLTLRDLIQEFNSFQTITFANLLASVNQLQLDWNEYQIEINDKVDIVTQDVSLIKSEQIIQNGRLSNIEDSAVLANGNNAFTGNNTFSGTSTFSGSVELTNSLEVNTTGAIKVPVGSSVSRPTPKIGLFRYNSDTNSFEGYSNAGWGSIGGGATGGAGNAAFWENDTTISQNYTISTGKNAGTFGPVTIANGVAVTVPNGSTWTIV